MKKKIEILYYTGEVDGIKITHKSSSSIYAYTIPRTLIQEAKNIPKLNNPSLYYLIYENEDSLISVYIGQTRGGLDRLSEHNRSKDKDFWNKAIIFISDDEHFNPTVILGLEKTAIERATAAKKYNILNKQEQKVVITEWMAVDIDYYYEEIEFLLSTMGYTFMQKSLSKNFNVVSTKRRGINANGIYYGEKFEVIEGSQIDFSKAANLESYNILRKSLFINNDITEEAGKYILNKSVEFKTPSGASDFVLGGSTNGWKEWTDKDGITLDELYRKN